MATRVKTGKAAKRNSDASRVAALKDRIADMYHRRIPYRVIAIEVGLSLQRVGQLVVQMREEALERSRCSIDQKRADQIDALDHLKAVAWKAWEESKKPLKKRSKDVERALVKAQDEVKDALGGNNKFRIAPRKIAKVRDDMKVVREQFKRSVEQRVGDPRFLDQVAWCIEMQARIEGLIQDKNLLVDARQGNFWELLVKPPDEEPGENPVAARLKALEEEPVDTVETTAEVIDAPEQQQATPP